MRLLLSGLTLFASTTLLAIAIGAAFVSTILPGSSPREVGDYMSPTLFLGATALITSIVLVLLAGRGRRQPLGDGVITINAIVLGYCFWLSVAALAGGPSPYPDSQPLFAWMTASLFLSVIVPAHIIAYLALRRTPLLRGLTPPRKTKGPAEASP